MWRLTMMGSVWYAIEFDELNDTEVDNINTLLEVGDHALIVNDLADALLVLDIDANEVVIVEDK